MHKRSLPNPILTLRPALRNAEKYELMLKYYISFVTTTARYIGITIETRIALLLSVQNFVRWIVRD